MTVIRTLRCVGALYCFQSNLKAFMEHVRKSDAEKIGAMTNKGFDPNFVDRSSGGSILLNICERHVTAM